MRGFTQGHLFLKELCDSKLYDIIYIQEHWLTSPMLYKLQKISENYMCYGISAMDDKLSAGFLYGRPFGGTAIMIKLSLVRAVTNVATFERLVSVSICDILCINVYMPCKDGSISSLNLVHEILANAADIIEQSSAEYILFGGDINVNVSKKSAHALAINDFLSTYKLMPGHVINNTGQVAPALDESMGGSKDSYYTFSNEKLGRYTTIDFLFVSKNVIDCVLIYKALDSATNHSDHLSVFLSLNLPSSSDIYEFIKCGNLLKQNNAANEDADDKNNKNMHNLRWDKADINKYYDTSRDLLYPVYNDIEQLYASVKINTDINGGGR